MEDAGIKKQHDLTWLENLQKNSWEPEVIISGISLAVLFIIPSRLFEYSVVLIQDYGLEQIPALLVILYFSLIISVFKIFLISHLLLRFMWAGMLGITYAFPEGVLKGKLFKFSQNVEYKHPNHFLLKLERWCSMAYGYPLTIAIPLFSITVYLILLIIVYLFFQLDFQIIYFVFMVSFVVLFLVVLILNKSGISKTMIAGLNGTIGAVYTSHLGKWTTLSFSLGLFLAAIPFVLSDLTGFSQYQPISNLEEEFYDWPEQSRYFEEYNSVPVRFPRVWTETKSVNSDQLNLYLARYSRDELDLPKLQVLLAGKFDTLQWGALEKVEDTYRIFLNDSLIQTENWFPITSGLTGQKAFFGTIPISHLESGIHEVRVERLTYVGPFLSIGNEPRHRKRWARFHFIKQ
ncbi:hypothetical protein [Algoriphagus sp.]|uniref:hypothetical protein n=1 Tax=Algoriphagus sp. TaxID=1872435 RepID=UPI00391CCC63